VIRPIPEPLPDRHHWLRVADESWEDPLDPTYVETHGGRWNPPGSFPVLYLNEDVATAKAQITQMLAGWPMIPDDLDRGYVLVTATLPRGQVAADAVTDAGLEALGLPDTYPLDHGTAIGHEECQPIGAAVKLAGLRGVHARSAATSDDRGRELAWFPARPSSRARKVAEDQHFTEWYWR
jgi:hypothetical protein